MKSGFLHTGAYCQELREGQILPLTTKFNTVQCFTASSKILTQFRGARTMVRAVLEHPVMGKAASKHKD